MDNDTISRQAAIDMINAERKWINHNELFRPYHYHRMNEAVRILHQIWDLPPVQPKQKTGQWLINSDGYYPYCSRCNNEPQSRIMTDYCPNCGAYMKGESNGQTTSN